MREAMLIAHLLGLTMALGSSFAFLFLGISGSKLETDERRKFILNTSKVSTMGHIGLTLLILSGGYLMTPFWGILFQQALLVAKLILVLVLIVTVSLSGVYLNKVKKGADISILKKIKVFGRASLLLGISIVILAVLVFR